MMQLCPAQKHYYDNTQYSDCPYCRTQVIHASTPKTQVLSSQTAPQNTLPNVSTRIIGKQDLPHSPHFPTVGWLVICEGVGKGRDFRLIQGENRIGRGAVCEICVDFGDQSDDTISREAHATVVYDAHAHEFFIERGNSRNLPLLNGAAIRGEPTLQHRDKIQIGETVFMFIALCDGQFHW